MRSSKRNLAGAMLVLALGIGISACNKAPEAPIATGNVDEARLASIWVAPKCRGTGLIDACYERFEGICGAAGFRYFYTFTWIGNHGSRKLSLRRGFREVGKIDRYSFRWQREGRGLYIRRRIPREPLGAVHPGGDLALPEVID